MTNFAANNTNASAGNIKICEITPRNGSPTELNAVVTNLSYYENLLSNSITSSFIISDSGSLNKKENSGILDGLPIRGGEKVKLQIEDAQYTRNILNIELYVNRIKNANPTTNKDVFILDLSTLEFINNEKVRVIKRYNESISDNVTRILKEVLKTAKPIDADPTGIPYNFIGNERKPFYVCSWLASRSVPTKGIGGAAGYFFYETSLGYKFKSIDVLNAQPPKKKYVYSNNEQIAEQYDAKILSMTVERDMDLQQNLSLGVYANRTLYFDFFNLEYIPSIYTIGSQEPKLTLIGELGSPKDAIGGIDIEITKDGKTLTGQIKPYREMILDGNTITLMGTAAVSIYKTDLMIFQKGKSVLIFNKKPKIVHGNFVFSTDSLVYNIQ